MELVPAAGERPALRENEVPWLLQHPALSTLPSCRVIALISGEMT